MVIGFFCVRHTEIYFAMLTLAFGMMVFSLIWNLRSVTGATMVWWALQGPRLLSGS